MNRFIRLCLFTALLIGSPAQAEEVITAFHSDIKIARDASMRVTEHIRVHAEGQQIRRGIYRDFPTTYTDHLGNAYQVTFDVLDVQRNGRSEVWHSENRSNGVRVYIGSRNSSLTPGPHSYTLTYTTNRQIGYFERHDELYWNVTGNGWGFAIQTASAKVMLPESVAREDLSIIGFTGRTGSTEQAVSTTITAGAFEIASQRLLQPNEGLTLVATWPKGIVHQPSALERFTYLLQDNRGLLIALLTLLGVAAYLYWQWHRVGRDPEPGPIFAHYDPPQGYSPASARFITKMGYDMEAFSAAIVSLAVKGHITIVNEDGDYTLLRQQSDTELAPGEAILATKLFSGGDSLVLDDKNHRRISSAQSAHKKAIKRDYANTYFLTNTSKLWPSILITILSAGLIGVLGSFTPLAVACLVIALTSHFIAGYLLKAPTTRGRRLMDQLEGFKLYMEVAEKDDMANLKAPSPTPELFERYLPFAIALGVQQAWAEKFTEVFERLAQDSNNSSYRPAWYHGNFNHHNLSRFSSDIGSSFQSSISSASTPPGSSSGGGGGGFSGGGGGGGGGGGW